MTHDATSATCVLDSSAILALLRLEPGHEIVGEVVDGAAIGAVNLAEIVAKTHEQGRDVVGLLDVLRQSLVEVVALDPATAVQAGVLNARMRRAGLSLGDACCIALAQTLAVPVYTADRVWAGMELGVDVRLIR